MTATADSSVPLVEMRGIGKTYGNISALTGISLRIHAGEVTGILGDNGAGKSTLIKIMAGLHQPTEGDLLVDGEPTNWVSRRSWTRARSLSFHSSCRASAGEGNGIAPAAVRMLRTQGA